MSKTPKSVRALRTYYKSRDIPFNIEHFAKEVQGESDRALVILLTAMLDDTLTLVIANRMAVRPINVDQLEEIFRFEGPLGSFSARIEIAYLFGFIDELMRDQLTDFREMRNACAHSKHYIGFDVPELANVAKRLFAPRGFSPLGEDTQAGIRNVLLLEFGVIHNTLWHGSRERGIESMAEALKKRRKAQPAELPPSPDKCPQR
jgi:hypothetical protein